MPSALHASSYLQRLDRLRLDLSDCDVSTLLMELQMQDAVFVTNVSFSAHPLAVGWLGKGTAHIGYRQDG